MIGIQIAGRGPCENDRVIHEEQGGAGILAQRIEGDLSVGGAGAFAGTDAVMSCGPANFSTPVVMASAWRC